MSEHKASAQGLALELRSVRKSFGKTEIIRGTELAIKAGERVAMIGPSGAGKSTLFNLISGRLPITSGEILLNGKPIHGMKPYEINRLGLARSFQVSNLFPRLSVFENIRCAVLWSMGERYAFWRFLSKLDAVNQRAACHVAHLRRAACAGSGRDHCRGGDVILLDEPTAGMSKSETANFVRMIREVTEGKTLLTVEHDMGVVFGLADRIAVLVYGEVIAFDTPENVRANDRVKEAYLGSVLAQNQAAEAGV